MKKKSLKKSLFLVFSALLAIVLTAVLFFTPLAAQRATLALDDLITTGKTQLFQKSVPGALGAYQTFLGAANDPAYSTATAQQKIQIRGYLAFTRIFDVILRNDGGTTDTLTELLGKYGVTRTGNTLETLTFQPTFNKDHKLVLPPTAPGGEAIRSFLAGPFLTALNASIADMDEVINQCGAGEGVVIIEKNYISAGETLNVEVDAGDYYLYRAALKALKAWALIVSAYNLDVSVQEIVGLANADLLNFKGLLERYPNLLKLLTAGGTPAYNGAAKLAEAKAALQGAIADYLVASNKIRNYGPATAGAKKLFTIEMPDRQREQFFREGILNKVSASLTGGTPFELVTDTETWEFTSTSPASSHKVTVNLKELQSKGDVRTDGYIFNDYMGFTGTWGTKIDYTLVQGSDFVLRFHVPGYSVPGQVYYNTVEFRGTISGTSMTGTYRTGLYSQSWEELTYRGNFTAVRTAYDDSRRERINPNALLGNGTTAPSLRDLLPEFTDYGWGNPKIGTMGHGLGNDATLNGLLPDFTQNRWAKDLGDILQYSGLTGGIPVVANGAIVVDGLVGDWAGINPVYNNTVGDNDNDPGRNIAQVWLAQDENFLYLRMDTAGSRLNPNTMYDYAVRFTTRPGDGPEMAGDVRVWARYAGYDTWQLNIPAQNGQPARTLTMSAWGANEWGSYQTGQGFISGPQGDPVFPSPTSPAPLNNGWMSTGGGWFNFIFTSGTNTYCVSGSADTGGNISGASVSVYLNGAWNSSYSNVTGTRTAHAPFWQTFLSRAASSPQGVSYGPWEDLNNSGGTFVNMSAGLENHVEWKVPRSQIGPVAGLFIQPETRVWGSWGRPGVENRTSIQIGPDQGASLASITGSVTVPSFDGTGEVIISVYEYHNFQKTAEYLLGTLVIPAAQFVNGMTYTIPNLPAGKRVFVTVDWTRGNTSGQPGPGDYTNFSLPFTTTAGATTQNITAADDHPAYPAPQFTSAKVSSIRQTNTTAATLQYALYAEIAGGSPEDLAVTVTGPNGARFTLTPMTTTFFDGGKQTFGWYYMGTSLFPDGDYTFEAVDSLGRKAVVTRNFTFNGALPLIDPAKLTPTSAQPYTGTVTPTFTWTLPGTLPANYRIHVRVLDAFNSANGTGGVTFMYQSANLLPTTTSLTVPAGILQPETWYSWSVQIIDGDDRVTNMARTIGYAFYTGNYAASPAITWGTILTQPPTGTITEYRHMAYCAIPGVYPMEIVSGRVKDASGNTINASLRVAGGYETKKYGSGAFYIVYGSAAPLTNGNYKIELTINRGGTTQVIESAALPYAYHNTGAPDISALTPANNYYFNTTTPTLSWPLVAASDIWYRARVWDPLRRVEIAHSGWMKDTTSWTVPAGKLARGMSYYWTLQTSADWDPAKPAATGQLNSFNFVNFEGNPANRAMFLFTINPEEATTYQLSVSRDGSGTGTITSSPAGIDCGGTCAAAFAPGLVSLTATPDYGFCFAGWTGCDAVTGNQCVINMNGAKAVKATFTGTPPVIAVSGIVKDWNGNVIPGGVTVSLVSDPMVTTTASPADGSFNLTGVPMNTPFSLKFSAPGYLDTYTVNVGGQSSNVNISSDNYGGSGPVFMPTSFDLLAFGALPDPNKAVITGRVSDQTFRYSTYVAGAVVTAQGLNATYPVKYRDPFGNLVDSASTWGNGRYYILNVNPEDTVTLTAQKANWTFAPRTFNTHGNAHSQGRIYGTAPGYDASVSGYVKSFTTGAAIAGATLSLYGDPGKTVNSTGDGSYTMTGLPRDVQFYMKVTAAGYVDAYKPYSNLPGVLTGSIKLMVTAAEMTGLGVDSGNGLLGVAVLDGTNMAPLAGATVTLQSKSGRPYIVLYPGGSGATGTGGEFLVPNVLPGDVVKMDVAKGGYTFKTAYLDCFAGSVTEVVIFGTPKYNAAMWSSHSIMANGEHSYWVDTNVNDPQELINSVGVIGDGITGNLALQFNAANKQWNWWYNGATGRPIFGATPPALPLNYTMTITEKGGALVHKNFIINAFPNSFATDVLPANGAMVFGTPVFSWSGYGAGYKYFLHLQKASGEYVWGKGDVTSPVTYDGPALTPGDYVIGVDVLDPNGNQSFVYHQFTYSSALPALKGDINGDNVVDMADGIIALKVIAGGAGEGIRAGYATSGADVNGDGRVGLAEVIYILQKAAVLRQ